MIYPPIDTDYFHPVPSGPDRFALVISALVPYKRIDLTISACRLAGIPLTIVKNGPERTTLERGASTNVQFLERCSDEDIRALYQRTAITLLPSEEDFGIVPLETQACNRPVVALDHNGALETIVAGETGILISDSTAEAFADRIAKALDHQFDAGIIRHHAERFSRARFANEMATALSELTA